MDGLCSRACAELGTVLFGRVLSMRACHPFSFRRLRSLRERVERPDGTTFFPRGLTNEDALPLNCGVRGFRAAH